MRLETAYRFINMDKPEEFIDIDTYGDGLDTGDKAPGKAMTYADKYALMKAYKISTGDDPDKEASPEKGYRKNEGEINLDISVDFQKYLVESETDLDKLIEHFGATNEKELTNEQRIEAIEIMKKKIKRG